MNREIKFRGKRLDNNEWVYGFFRKNTFYNKLGDEPKEIYTKHFIGSFSNLELFDNIFEQVEVIPESVGQFTGLKDKNGVDIYEGDILRLHNYQGEIFKEIVFYNGCFCIHGFNLNVKYSEIIGNIHENPELLNND